MSDQWTKPFDLGGLLHHQVIHVGIACIINKLNQINSEDDLLASLHEVL